MPKNTFNRVSSITYDFRCSTIFQTNLIFDDFNFFGRRLDEAFLGNHTQNPDFSHFRRVRSQDLERWFQWNYVQIVVLFFSWTWKNFTVRSFLDAEIWLCEMGPQKQCWVSLDTVLQSYFTRSYLHVKTTLALNWWLINAYNTSGTSVEHICFGRKYFFLRRFGTPTWLHRA